MPTTTFNRTAALFSGAYNTDPTPSIQPRLGSLCELVATGTKLECAAIILTTGAVVMVSVDGATEFALTPTAVSTPEWMTTFDLPGEDVPHTVTYRLVNYPNFDFLPNLAVGGSSLDDPIFRVTGASPACTPPAGYSNADQYLIGQSADDGLGRPGALDHVRLEAGYIAGSGGVTITPIHLGSDNGNIAGRYGSQARFYGTAGGDGTIEIWTYQDWTSFRVSVDGVWRPRVNSPNRPPNPSAGFPGTGRWGWLTVATGLDTSRHLFGIICSMYEEGEYTLGSGGIFAVRIKGGSIDLTDRPAKRPVLGLMGDSICNGTLLGGQNFGPLQVDAGMGFPLRSTDTLGYELRNMGLAGTLVKYYEQTGSYDRFLVEDTGEARTNNVTDLVGTPDEPGMIWLQYGTNDFGQVGSPTKPIETKEELAASYLNMIGAYHAALPTVPIWCNKILPRGGTYVGDGTLDDWNDTLVAAITGAGISQYHIIDYDGCGYDNFGLTTLDNLHPNPNGHDIITKVAVGTITGNPTLSAIPVEVYAGHAVTLYLCGTNVAAWDGSTAYGASAGTLGSPTNISGRRASIGYTAPSTAQTVTITETTSGVATTIRVVVPSFTITPSTVAPGSTTTMFLFGTNTYWGDLDAGVVPDTVFTPSAGTVGTPDFAGPTGRAEWTTASFDYTAPSTPGIYPITDESSGATSNIQVGSLSVSDHATRFDSSLSQYAEVADGTKLVSAAGQSLAVGGWFNFASASIQQFLLGKGSIVTPTALEYALRFNPISPGFQADISDDTTASASGFTGTNPTTGLWYFILMWYDAVAGTINVQISNGTVTSAAATGIAADTSALFRVGADSFYGLFLDAKVNSAFVLQRATAPTSGERTWLYNSGTGRIAADLVGDPTGGALVPAAGKGDWWDLNDAGPNHVGAFNGVVLANAAGGAAPTQVSGGIPRLASGILPPSYARNFPRGSSRGILRGEF